MRCPGCWPPAEEQDDDGLADDVPASDVPDGDVPHDGAIPAEDPEEDVEDPEEEPAEPDPVVPAGSEDVD